jgi:hypothetical protein
MRTLQLLQVPHCGWQLRTGEQYELPLPQYPNCEQQFPNADPRHVTPFPQAAFVLTGSPGLDVVVGAEDVVDVLETDVVDVVVTTVVLLLLVDRTEVELELVVTTPLHEPKRGLQPAPQKSELLPQYQN